MSGVGCRFSSFVSQVSCLVFRVSGFGFRLSGVRFRVSGFGSQASGFGYRVSGFGFRISVSGVERTWKNILSGCVPNRGDTCHNTYLVHITTRSVQLNSYNTCTVYITSRHVRYIRRDARKNIVSGCDPIKGDTCHPQLHVQSN